MLAINREKMAARNKKKTSDMNNVDFFLLCKIERDTNTNLAYLVVCSMLDLEDKIGFLL